MPIVRTNKKMRPREKHDNYPTPKGLVKEILKWVYLMNYPIKSILDPGAGSGVWGEVAREFWPEADIVGIDIRKLGRERTHPAYNYWFDQDYLDPFGECTVIHQWKFDLIMGNPPYKYAEEFVRRSQKLLSLDGVLVFLLRLDFLTGINRGKGLWKDYRPFDVKVCSRRPSFTGDKKTYADNYAVYFWEKESYRFSPFLGWLEWNYE